VKGASRDVATLFIAPRRFFRAQAEGSGGNLQATAFALAVQLGGSSLEWLWYRLGWSAQSKTLALVGTFPKYLLFQMAVFAVILPLEAVAVQLFLLTMGAARASLAATYRVCAYAQVAALASIVPFAGMPLGIVAGMGMLVVAIKEAHQTSTGNAVFVAGVGLARLLALLILAVFGVLTVFHYR
jgi:hypothetical protein